MKRRPLLGRLRVHYKVCRKTKSVWSAAVLAVGYGVYDWWRYPAPEKDEAKKEKVH